MSSSTDIAADQHTKPSPAQAQSPSAPQGSFYYISSEHQRARHRRTAMGIVRPPGHEDVPWALAFSGGGIRSATFCLGVLQGLTQADTPSQSASEIGIEAAARRSLLRQFDYLSTVSGGGFIGSFFTSLFGKKRLDLQADLDERATALQAYQVFAEDPPGRLRSTVHFDAATPGVAPLAWLRENGRYLAPTGSGDMVYAAALAIRNWCATHYVLGALLLALYLLLAFAHVFVMQFDSVGWIHAMREYEIDLLREVASGQTKIWWSPTWWLILPLLMLWLLPSGLAFWMTHPPLGKDLSSAPQRFSRAGCFALLAGLVLMAFAWFGQRELGVAWKPLAEALAALGFLAVAGVVWHALTSSLRLPTISAQRVALTRSLALAMMVGLTLVLFAAVHTAAQTLYVYIGSAGSSVSSAAMVTAIVWIVRRLESAFEEKERKGWLARIPFNTVVNITGIVLLFMVTLFWALVVLWIQWRGALPDLALLENPQAYWVVAQVLGVCLLLVIGLNFIIGRFPGFLNLSTLQGLYSAQLTRAYLGASNGMRFDARVDNKHWRSVAQPVPGDHMTPEAYYQNALAPMHFINICMNQNSDPAEQLVQRDRKGKPLSIVPGGFLLDGTHHPLPDMKNVGAMSANLTIGEWIGVSGAAIATGMGRAGGLGRGVLNGLANLRLGRWWESGVLSEPQSGASRRLRQLFKTQAYLFDELFARFYGTRRPLHYLSDGGHFDNTALYELLRPQRGVRLAVACDCGCDPQFQFADVANVIRLARIDFGTEIEVDRNIAQHEILGKVFGTPDQFLAGCVAEHAAKCALLLNVYHTDASYRARRPDARVVVIKPRLLPGVCADLGQYQAVHCVFPQEPTADQFYDEAQWESYRKLGLETAKIIFGAGMGAECDAYCEALWRHLLRR